ncbi:MAG: RNA polymerase factor sigma-54 [Geminicoccaceae bacterium]|nr:RNA polymerase factor sigma-54 [Geminicoccaceae bacterium]MDW8123882.1 RNA polymerase factor sigma-54 [Geminicoccaceae bacterium]
MAVAGFRLELRQTQGLVLTPQLQQAIRLLQLNNLELAQVVERELVENPFLVRAEPETRPAAVSSEREPELSGRLVLAPREDPEEGWNPPPAEPAADRRLRTERANAAPADERLALEARLARAPTLAEHLRAQLVRRRLPPEVAALARELCDWLDADGYLREDDAALAAALRARIEDVAAARAAILGCEPTGCGARDLRQCLAAQLAERDRLDPAMAALLDHLPLVARADFAALQRVCRLGLDDVKEMIAEIKALDPRPGLSFAPAEPLDVVPDLLVRRAGPSWRIELNRATLPRVLVDRDYYVELNRRCRSRSEKEFLSERYQAASWLVKALDQRARTMLKVARAIFVRQRGFLERGPAGLKPLVLREIAEATGLHESTVSRATADKYVATPRGTLPLRYFFTTALADSGGGEGHSAEAIRQEIRRMIDNEPPDAVLSDDQIVALLRARGVVIARRTVAKYRESLGIPSSVARRRAKALTS